jgi:hypothetical protein
MNRKVHRMNLPKLKSKAGHTAAVIALAGGMLGGFGAAAASAQVGTQLGAVTLTPASGPTSTTPSYQTTIGCPTGFQGSAILRIEEGSSGNTFSLAGAVNNTANAFSGTLLGPISEIQSLSGLANGGTDELVVFCFSGDSETGTSTPYMDEYLHISSDGSSYSSDTSTGGGQVPIGEVGGLVFAGLAAIGLVFLQLRRRSRRTQPSEA